MKGFTEAADKYARILKKEKLKHAGRLSYADERGRVTFRKTKAGKEGELEPVSWRDQKKAMARQKIRKRGSRKQHGRVIGDG